MSPGILAVAEAACGVQGDGVTPGRHVRQSWAPGPLRLLVTRARTASSGREPVLGGQPTPTSRGSYCLSLLRQLAERRLRPAPGKEQGDECIPALLPGGRCRDPGPPTPGVDALGQPEDGPLDGASPGLSTRGQWCLTVAALSRGAAPWAGTEEWAARSS
ncbi:unnamed protein product [Rangifer tarandus platyrhynchus]|uniref:Uncharacterized protein n=1 Tax=Rangifer tarandus platyrhynchus TaxID=3082113 RepID=A0AC59YGA6_RANTA